MNVHVTAPALSLPVGPFTGMSPAELWTDYDALWAADAAHDGIHAQPQCEGPALHAFFSGEGRRLSAMIEEIVHIARTDWPAGEDAEALRLAVLKDYAARVEDREIDLEVAAALIAFHGA